MEVVRYYDYSDVKQNSFDISGQVFGYLIAFERKKRKGTTKAYYGCTCLICGKEVDVTAHNLRSGITKSCGCLRTKNGRRTASQLNQTLNGVFRK